jgi:hypothetical protein
MKITHKDYYRQLEATLREKLPDYTVEFFEDDDDVGITIDSKKLNDPGYSLSVQICTFSKDYEEFNAISMIGMLTCFGKSRCKPYGMTNPAVLSAEFIVKLIDQIYYDHEIYVRQERDFLLNDITTNINTILSKRRRVE